VQPSLPEVTTAPQNGRSIAPTEVQEENMIRTAAIVFVAALAASAAFAQNATPDNENGRFTFKQMGDELLRLDGRTGQVSLCEKRTAGWSCLSVPDERQALETEISRLQRENATLKREMIARGIPLPGGLKAPQQAERKTDDLTLRLPNDADLDRMMGFMEKVWKRLIDMVQSMQREIEKKG
jgi:hypothetical protein